jgi:anti-sigma factor RsiW
MDTNMHNCPNSANVDRYHDDVLSPAEREAFEAHLPACPACSEELRQLSAIRQALRAIALPTASREFVADLQSQWDHVPQLTVLRFVSRLTKVAAVVAVVAMGHLAYEAMARPARAAQVPSAAPAAWEQVAIAPDSSKELTTDEQAPASSEPRFAQFVVQDLGGERGRP